MNGKVFIDTNLLLLLIVGLYDKEYIGSHKRTANFSVEDFEILIMLLERVQIVVLSSVYVEVSNLLWQTKGPHCDLIRSKLKEFIMHHCELHISSQESTADEAFPSLGLTDAGILKAAAEDTILTVDLDLYLAAQMRSQQSENFNHYRYL